MRHRKRPDYFWIIGTCLFSAVLALSISAMICSGHVNLWKFYDVGEICDLVCNDEGIYAEGTEYDYVHNSYRVLENTAAKSYMVQTKDNVWNYAYVKVRLFNADCLNVTLQGYDSQWNESYSREYSLTDGDNYLAIGGHVLAQCRFLIENQAGKEFAIIKVRFYEKEISVWGKKAWFYAGILWLCFLPAGVLSYKKKRVFVLGLNRLIDFWQDIFCFLGERACNFCRRRSPGQIQKLRILLFLAFIWGSHYFFITEIYQNNMNYVYLFGSVMTGLLALLCLEKKPVKLAWNQRIVYLWMIVWGISILSDLLTGKSKGSYLGIVMLGPFSFFLFAWHNMERPMRLFDDLLDAVEISVWIRIFYALCFDPYQTGSRYLGIDGNPGILAMFLLVALVMFASRIERQLNRDRVGPRYFGYLAGAGILLQFFWHTQSVTGIGTLLFLGILYLGRFLLRRKFVWKKKRRLLLAGSAAIVLLAFFGTQEIMSRNLAPAENLVVAADLDFPKREWSLLSEPVQAKSIITESRIYQKFVNATSLETLTTGRNLYWAEFLRSMNLFGNEKKVYFWAGGHLGHNSVLTMGSQYGILVITPYAMLLLAVVCAAAKKVRIKSDYRSVFVFGCAVGGIMASMGDNVEQPFLLLIWIALYLCIGAQFPSGTGRTRQFRLTAGESIEK